MSKPTEGKPVFPVPDDAWGDGISERRYYIGQALMGICANPNGNTWDHEGAATEAIGIADAVMSILYPQPNKEPNQ